MSNEAITWAYRQPIMTGAKFVLVALADLADEEHSCFPGQAKLAAMTGQSDRTVRRQLAELELAGYITRKRRFDGAGHRTSDRYILPVNADVLPIPTGQNDQRSERPPVKKTTGQRDHRPNRPPVIHDSPTGQDVQVSLSEPPVTPQPPAASGARGSGPRKKHCARHVKYRRDCINCVHVNDADAQVAEQARADRLAAIAACDHCDPDGWQLAADGSPTARKCTDHSTTSREGREEAS